MANDSDFSGRTIVITGASVTERMKAEGEGGPLPPEGTATPR